MTEKQLTAATIASLGITLYLILVPTLWVWAGLVVSGYFTWKLVMVDYNYLNVRRGE
jgi:hypothetical protein